MTCLIWIPADYNWATAGNTKELSPVQEKIREAVAQVVSIIFS